MENKKLTCPDKDALDIYYEDLRDEILNPSAISSRNSQGLALFLRQGMIAWLEAWSKCAMSSFTVKEKEEELRQQKKLSIDLHGQVTNILTNMAINIWKEVKA